MLFDAAVLHGSGVVRWLQRIAGVKADGIIGLISRAAINSIDAHRLGVLFAVRRARYLTRLVRRRPDQLVFLLGWFNRVLAFLEREARRSR